VKLKLDINPDIVAMMAAEVVAGERAVTGAMREAGIGLKSAWRLQITGAGKSLRGGRITPGEWERRRGLRLRFVYRRTGPSLLVAEGRLNTKGQAVVSRSKTGRGKVTAPIFLLVPQVKLPKRLDLARDADRALDSVPGLIVANWVEGRS